MENGNLSRFFDQLDKRLGRIEDSIDKLVERHDEHAKDVTGRVSALEIKQAEQRGGYKVLAVIGAAAGTVGGVIATFIGNFIPPRY